MKRLLLIMVIMMSQPAHSKEVNLIRYVALGDSYTIGTGTTVEHSWPAVLSRHLAVKSYAIGLAANLGRNGAGSEHVLEEQIGSLKGLNANFVTVLIGTNDVVRGVDREIFRVRFRAILDDVERSLAPDGHILVLNLPDFMKAPGIVRYELDADTAEEIKVFNQIIADEAGRKNIPVFDLYTVSRKLNKDPANYSPDGLHPSKQGYALWEQFILPDVEKLLSQ